MSYVEILILRRLRSGPAHGYELRKRVEQTTGFVLHNNSLYPALRRFEEAGAVTKTTEPQQGRPPRLVYSLTDVGHELLHDMLADLPADQAADDTEFLARLGQFSLINSAERAAVLGARTRAVHQLLAHAETMRDLAVASGERWGALVTTELLARYTRELAWLAELANLAAQPEPASGPDAQPESRGQTEAGARPASESGPDPDPEPGARPASEPEPDHESEP